MENKPAQILEALSAFIHGQRSLLARTQSDIERLKKLKNEAIAQPTSFVSNLSNELNASTFRLSEQIDCLSRLPENIDWSVYAVHDPAPLRALALTSRHAYSQRNQPHTRQRSELSDLQKFVKEARRTIIDPVLAEFAHVSEPDDSEEEDEEIDSEEERRERERQKIRELKNRRITSGCLTIPFRTRGPTGVFVRRDLEDESAEVDISVDDNHDYNHTGTGKSILPPVPMDIDTSTTATSLPSTTWPTPPPSTPMALAKSSRLRRPSTKLQAHARDTILDDQSTSRRSKQKSKNEIVLKSEPEPEPPPPKSGLGKRSRDPDKPKPETYKLAWSVSEQHLLERLLEEIPDGAKNRWQKISRAMNGRRTPRQVASRVQKYFEKLKRFGIGVDSGGGSGSSGATEPRR